MSPRLVAAVLLAVGAVPAAAQVRFDVKVGVSAATNLETDSIVEALTLRQNVAPTIGVAINSTIGTANHLGLSVSGVRGDLVLHAASGNRNLVELTTWTPTITLTHDVSGGVAVSAAAGVIAYDPDHEDGTIFSQGAPVRGLLGVGLHLRHMVGPTVAAGLDVTYDVHQFMTRALENQGFVGAWTVHRVAVGLTLGHRNDAARP